MIEEFIRAHLKTITMVLIILAMGLLIWSGFWGAQQYYACSAVTDRLTKGTLDACGACDALERAGIIKSR